MEKLVCSICGRTIGNDEDVIECDVCGRIVCEDCCNEDLICNECADQQKDCYLRLHAFQNTSWMKNPAFFYGINITISYSCFESSGQTTLAL